MAGDVPDEMPDNRRAVYAADASTSRGRRHPEPAAAYRGEYQRDRDRIIHSAAFRRLMYKTQVFVNHEGDMYRTRLTHSLEVAQIARTAARALGLDEHLTEAICLAHDLGHTPFGHAGQDALNACMRDYGGFEHNLQSLRVVDELENRYAEFRGLNLMFETREGILKHCSVRNARELGELGERFLERRQPGLEAQLADVADAIAYNNHDVDDGLRSGLLGVEQLREQPLFETQYLAVVDRYPGLESRKLVFETIRRMIDTVVSDLIVQTRANLRQYDPRSIDEVRFAGRPLVGFSAEIAERHVALKRFLNRHLYLHEDKLAMSLEARTIVEDLFGLFIEDQTRMPADFAAACGDDPELRARTVADYIAGMTDRFALAEHERLTAAA